MTRNIMRLETQYCLGCKTCEIACSYHQKKSFGPGIASIEISKGRKEPSFTISFYGDNQGDHLPCDGCQGEDEPLCVKYCHPLAQEELKGFLHEFLSKR